MPFASCCPLAVHSTTVFSDETFSINNVSLFATASMNSLGMLSKVILPFGVFAKYMAIMFYFICQVKCDTIFNMTTIDHFTQVQIKGYTAIAGVDEAGAGALAGPIVAGAVILDYSNMISGLADSKTLSERKREELYSEIILKARDWAFGMATVEEIIELGIRPANYLAMKRAVEKLREVDYALVDAWHIPELRVPQQGIIRGDKLVKVIGAASIIAKVTRDRMMIDLHDKFPDYGFNVHKGYGTRLHRDKISQLGACELHRTNFRLC
jgi:ribonuclease HII